MPWRFNLSGLLRSSLLWAHRFFFIPWAIAQPDTYSERIVISKRKEGRKSLRQRIVLA